MSIPETISAGAALHAPAVSRQRVAPVILGLVALAAVASVVGLALLWLARNPLLTGWDELGHADATLADAALARAHAFGPLRDQFFLFNRWQPPGLRVLGIPVALAFPHAALTALRLSATVCFLLTAGLLYLGLRRVTGVAGAAAAVLAFALAPVTIIAAQNFMTEEVLLVCAAAALAMLAADLRAGERDPSPAGLARLVVLGLALGWGTLTKLTFLPTFGILWLGVAVWLWWQGRSRNGLLIRLLLPAALLLMVAWPVYALNGPRYLAYAHATANGFGFHVWPERGFAFAARIVRSLAGDAFGPAGIAALAIGLLLCARDWRRITIPGRVLAALCVLASLPTLAAFCFSRNQTVRYLVLDALLLAVPAGLGFGAAVRRGGMAGGVAVAATVVLAVAQTGLAWAIAFGAPGGSALLSGLAEASTRPNFACDYRVLARRVVPRDGPVRIGIMGESRGVNPNDVYYGFARAGVPVQVVQFSNSSADSVDWPPILSVAAQVDYVLIPVTVHGWYKDLATNRARDAFPAQLATVAQVTPLGVLSTGPDPACRATLLDVHPRPDAPPPRRPPLLSESFIPEWSVLPAPAP